ncbi:hypothetical protein BsWGS_18935 [Bradybaena similaris]
MGCGGYSKVSKPDVNGAVYRKVTKDQVHIEVGNKVRVQDRSPTIIFVYGGPGSKKGRLVSELVEVFDFTFINVEKVILQRLAEASNKTPTHTNEQGDRKESIHELKKILEEDPSTVSLQWILREITAAVDANPHGRYLVDMMPNLKYVIKTANFSKDCSIHMSQFEEKYTISFSLYFSLNINNKSKNSKKVEEVVKEENTEDKGGFQSDEVDLSRTKKRASMFENSVRSFLQYFDKSERLVTVDVSCRNADAVLSRLSDFFGGLGFQNLKPMNSVVVFIFDSKAVDADLLQEHDIEYVKLEKHGTRLSLASLEDAVRTLVNKLNHKEHKTYLVDLSATNITKQTSVEAGKSVIVFVNEANIERYFNIPGCQGKFKTVSSLENAVCVFPTDTNPDLCKKITVAFNNEISSAKGKHSVQLA